MKKTRFTETQIASILKQHEAGRPIKELAREHGISDATFYNWKAKYGGMEASDVNLKNSRKIPVRKNSIDMRNRVSINILIFRKMENKCGLALGFF